MKQAEIGVIGGSGLYDLLQNAVTHELETPFGMPSGPFSVGEIGGVRTAFVPRHGPGHRIPPHKINYRANIHGFKQLGVGQLISVSAVGSLKEEIVPGHLVLADQFFDRTKAREATFYDELAVHIGFSQPVCETLRQQLTRQAGALGFPHHDGGTYVCMEGPAFSTRAESFFYRSLDASVIGMTNLPEAKLAREAEICYATIALATDYDCWKIEEDAVEVGAVLEILRGNVAKASALLAQVIPQLSGRSCACHQALEGAVMTDLGLLTAQERQRFDALLGRFLFAG